MDRRVFRIARGSSVPLWFCGGIGLLVLGLGVFLGTIAVFGSRIVTLEVAEAGVRVRGDVYGRFIPRSALQCGDARALDLGAEPGYAPVGRTNGIGLPNYQSGWFRLKNGSSGLLFVTDWSRAVLVPTIENFNLVVSPADPQAFLAALKQPATAVATFPSSSGAAPLTSAYSWLFFALCVGIPGALAAVLGYVAYSSRGLTFEVSEEGLRIRGDLFGRRIPTSSLRLEDARLVDLKEAPEHRPSLRTCGAGLPGYSSGWFRLRDHGKALLFLTDRRRAVYLPTSDGYALLISPEDPEGFLAALASRARQNVGHA
jgi:hypothetical protein